MVIIVLIETTCSPDSMLNVRLYHSMCRYGADKAQPMTDYIPISQTVIFSPGEMVKQVGVVILDDRSMPMVEGAETFRLALKIPDNAMLGKIGRS